MIFDHEARTVSMRQSWIDTALRCAERGRLDVVQPVREEGDAAYAGTCMHKAVEEFMNGNLSLDLVEQYAMQMAATGAREGVLQEDGTYLPISYKSFDGPNELIYHAQNCTRGWFDTVLPYLSDNGWLQGQAEVKFDFNAFNYRDYTVILKGTVDWVPDFGNTLLDWKSSGRDYKQGDKQRYSVQPTVYCAAAVAGCFGREFTWPVEFSYGIAIRLKTKARGQIVTVQRSQSHLDWLYHRLRTFVDLALDIGMDRPWPTTEENNFLCSEKWCPWYDQCRGKHLSRSDDLYGYVPS